MKRTLLHAVVAISSLAACKGTGPLYTSLGKPTVSVAPGSPATVTCGSPVADPANPQIPPVLNCTLDFGGVPIGQSVTANLIIGNDGASDYQITDLTPPTEPQFGVSNFKRPAEVSSGLSLAVSFKPFNQTPVTDSFTLPTNSQTLSNLVIHLSGSGINLAVAINPMSIDFGRVIVHSVESRPLTITNLSTGPITLSPIVLNGPSQALFSIAIDTASSSYQYSDLVQPGETIHFEVSFSPNQPSPSDENAYLAVTYAGDKFATVGLTGLGVKSGLCVTTGPVAVTPPSLFFGNVPLNKSVTGEIYVQNCSNETLKLYASYLENSGGDVFTATQPGVQPCLSATNCDQITPTDAPYALMSGDTLTYPITFKPVLGTGYSGEFAVQDDHGDNLVVPITGNGGGPDIVCTPQALDFGLVAAGIGSMQSVSCTNTGNDIVRAGKIVPSGELQVLSTGLTVVQTSTSFSAQLFIDGLATQEVSLRAGQSFNVQVTYDPAAVTSAESGILYMATNSAVTPVVQIDLKGAAILLTDCNLTISPTALDFDQIAPGQMVQLPVALTNAGNNACLIDGLALSPESDSAFTLVDAPPTSIKLCGAAEPTTDNCASPYGSSYQAQVQFQPTAAGNYQGLIDFVVSSYSAPSQIVPLSGSAGGSCLIVTPQELDFGDVGVSSGTSYCKSKSHAIRALNTCSYPLQVTGLTNSAQGVDFRISFAPTLPSLLQPGQSLEFDEQFVPTTAGAKYGSASIVAQPAGGGASQTYLAAFHGRADTQTQVDSYLIPPSKVDILWVVDFQNMGDMSTILGFNPFVSNANGLAQSLGSFFTALSGVDYQLSVITSIDCTQNFGQTPADFVAPSGGGLLGQLQMLPCSGCTDSSANNAQIITGADAHPETEMSTILSNMASSYWNPPNLFWFEGDCNVGQGPLLGGDALQPAYDALTAGALAGHNTGFLRDDAALVVIALNIEDDTSPNLTGNPLSYYLSYFQNLKAFNALTPFIFNAISITPDEVAARQSTCPNNNNVFLNGVFYPDMNIPGMVQQTAGQLVDVCTSNWGSALTSLGGTSSAHLTTFPLSGSPVDPPSGIQVAIASGGGPAVPIPQVSASGGAAVWTYDALINTITFQNPADAPGPTDTLTITYTNVCY
jgi:hypothetical protein